MSKKEELKPTSLKIPKSQKEKMEDIAAKNKRSLNAEAQIAFENHIKANSNGKKS